MSTTTSPSNPVIPALRNLPPELVNEGSVQLVELIYAHSVERRRLLDSGEYVLDLEFVRARRAYREACCFAIILVLTWLATWLFYPETALFTIIWAGTGMTCGAHLVKWLVGWWDGRRFFYHSQGIDPTAPNYDNTLNPIRIQGEARMWRSRARWRPC